MCLLDTDTGEIMKGWLKMDLDKLVNDLKVEYDLDGLLDGELNINDVLEDEIVYEYIREGFDMIEIESYILSQIK